MTPRKMSSQERAERDALIREWQRKSDATFGAAPEPTGFRRIIGLLRSYPGSLTKDLIGVIALFVITWAALVSTGTH